MESIGLSVKKRPTHSIGLFSIGNSSNPTPLRVEILFLRMDDPRALFSGLLTPLLNTCLPFSREEEWDTVLSAGS